MSMRRQYPFHLIEPKWQNHWDQEQTFRAWNPGGEIPAAHPFGQRHTTLPPKYYILDMFPYPSGPVLQLITTGTPQHPCFIRLESTRGESWTLFEFRLPLDPSTNVHLTVLCFHFPPPWIDDM